MEQKDNIKNVAKIECLNSELISLNDMIYHHKELLAQMEKRANKVKEEIKRLEMMNVKFQYETLKEKHPDAVLMFRCGDFYEMYNQDAIDVAKITGITLCNNNKTWTALAGFPRHALDVYLPKIIRAGKRVAICDMIYKF